jgi:3'5'-cyclic nucleotide phosphodiesterase
MSRITAPKLDDVGNNDNEELRESLLHEYTLGIATDPLLQFAIAFAALIHDVDHPGVPNVVLMKEDTNLAKKYRNKSVAEKHSIRLSWERLMDSDYHELRECLCPTQAELKRFRNFVVNTVMATDIADKELNGKRKERWSQCFEQWPADPSQDDIQRKATIVVEHLIQASDVAHTMQHFE